MKRFFTLAILLGSAVLLLMPSASVFAQGDYCWCIRPDGGCENHRSNAAGDDIECGGSGAVGCSAYCASRMSDGTPWRAGHCDPQADGYIERSREATTGTSGLICAPATEEPASESAGGSEETAPPPEPIRLYNPLGGDVTIAQFIGRGVRAVIGVVGGIALLMFIYGGIVWMTAGGSQERIASAKNVLKNSFIGLLLIFFSYTIITIFFSFLSG